MSENKPKKKAPSKKLNNKNLSYVFFGILIIGIIAVTVFVYLKQNNRKYTKSFGENITTTIQLSEDKINMIVKVGATEVKQQGTIKELDSGKDEVGKWTIYEATLEPLTEDEEAEVVQIKVYDKSLILAYDSGETVEYTR